MTRADAVKEASETMRRLVQKFLRDRTPSGYSFVVPGDGVMYVSDGVGPQHERWYVVVQVRPESVANTRAAEVQRIQDEVEQEITRRTKRTVFLMSKLPVV